MPNKGTKVLVKEVCKGMKNLKLRCIVLDADPIVEIFGRKYRLYRVADETARVNIVIWDEAVTKISGGDILKLTKLYCTVWRNRLTLFTSKYSRIYKQGKFCMTFSEIVDMSLPIEDESLTEKQIIKYSLKSFLGFSSVDEPDTNYTYKGKLKTEKKKSLEDAYLESMISDGDEEDEEDDDDEVDSDEDNENVLYSKLISGNRSYKKRTTTIGESINKQGSYRVIEEPNKRKTFEYLDFDGLEQVHDEKPNKTSRKNSSYTIVDDISTNRSAYYQSSEQNFPFRNNKCNGENLYGSNADNKLKEEDNSMNGTLVCGIFGDNEVDDGNRKENVQFKEDNEKNGENMDNTKCSNDNKGDTDKISSEIKEKELGWEDLPNENREKCEEEIVIYDSTEPPIEEANAGLDQYIMEVEDDCMEEPLNNIYVEKTHRVCVGGMIFEYVEEVEVDTTEMNDGYIEENIEYEEVSYETSTAGCDGESTEESYENFTGFIDDE